MSGRLLIVDDVATNRIVMKVKLTAAGYLPVVAADGATCLAMAQAEPPDLILLDLVLPDMSGTEVLRRLRADPILRRVPVVMFSASHAPDARIEAFRAGADEFLLKPLDDQTLLARIRSLMRAREAMAGFGPGDGSLPDLDQILGPAISMGLAEPSASFQPRATIALVMQRPETAMLLKRNLSGKIKDALVSLSPDEALASGLQEGPAPDIFMIEADLAIQGGGLRLMSDLRSRAATRNAAFMLYRGGESGVSPAMAFDLGAADMVAPETVPMELAMRLERLLSLKREADHLRLSVQDGLRLAVIDPLTGLHNRRYGLAQLQAIAERARATSTAFAVLVVDIDRFKSINDRFGHAAGDAVLVEVANRLRHGLRAGDLIARIGGEEFLIALPDIALPDARAIADRLCSLMQVHPFEMAKGALQPVTVSVGLAISAAGETPSHVETVTDIFDRADRALMDAKAQGRNQVTVSRSAA